MSKVSGDDLSKLRHYDEVTYRAITLWSNNNDPLNKELSNHVLASGLAKDDSSLGLIFKHLLWEGFNGDKAVENWFSFPARLINRNDWDVLKRLDSELYAGVRSYYIYSSAAKGNGAHVNTAIEKLRRLKAEMLEASESEAVALVSAWLGNEFQSKSHIDALVEFKYSFNYLKVEKEDSFKAMLSQREIAAYIANILLELQLYSEALLYADYILSIVPLTDRYSVDYIASVQALTQLGRFSEALARAESAVKLATDMGNADNLIVALILNLSVYTHNINEAEIDKIRGLVGRIEQVVETSMSTGSSPMIEAYIQTALTLIEALDGNEPIRLAEEVDSLTQKYEAWASQYPSAADINLRLYQNLQRIYEANGNYEKAYQFAKKYRSLKLDRNQLISSKSLDLGNDFLSKEVEFNKLRNIKINREKDQLTSQANFLKSILFGGLAIFLGMTTLWYRRRHNVAKALADVDSLTGAYTRRAINSWLTFISPEQVNCAVLLDIDYFKKINDNYGHNIGDEVLRTLSQIIIKRIRKIDRLCRYGGEEFFLVVQATEIPEAKAIIHAIRQEFESIERWGEQGVAFNVSFSAGIVTFKSTDKIDSVLERADHLLYEAKKTGRAKTLVE
ncbi:GGDEF domain-containing protein [Alteromonas sp. KUL106]|uniref:GGDEF domain-containing protein n=1 Tax=Alteromonas sp. KUL106 TaxID=2480799 RepID=UPI00135AEEAE|nr:GGDEF domain-containing protein [Alteromonas sp. KUL106]